MEKNKDRLLLGMIAGLGGNMVKVGLMQIAKAMKLAEFDGAETAAGIMLPAHKLAEPRGRLVGHIGDSIIAAFLGTATTYILSVTGKDKAILKGTAAGIFMWTALYGALGGVGISKVRPASPKTVISQFIAHGAFGAAAAILVTRLGDPGLFSGKIPLNASSKAPAAVNQAQQQGNPEQMFRDPAPQAQEQEQKQQLL